MEEIINIALAADAGYLVHARVLLYSLFDSNRMNRFCIYLFTEAVSHIELQKIKRLTEKFGNELRVMPINQDIFQNFFISKHITIATYYRLLIPNMLPEMVHRIIYLDIDILIKNNIQPLWATDLGSACLGAVDEKMRDHVTRLNLPVYDNYLNAGVLLINTDLWKRMQITEQGLALAEKEHDKLEAHDQDILNILLVGKWLSLSTKWNQMEGHQMGYLKEEPTIVHFVGPKPWSIHCVHPLKKDYYRYYYKMEGPGKRVQDFYNKVLRAVSNRVSSLK